MAGAAVSIPWRMWYGEDVLRLTWPDGWEVGLRAMRDAPTMQGGQIREALGTPLGSAPLAELAAGRKSCCILVDDLTRPTPAARVLPPMLEALHGAGLSEGDITIIVASGAHGALRRAALAKKLGPEVCDRYYVMRHDTHQNLVSLGEIPGMGAELRVNRFFAEADLKLAITGVIPHFMCGLSGGAKIVMPGACGLEAIAATHRHTVDGPPARLGVVEGNRMREIMEECARRAGLRFCVCCVFNSRGETAALFCGAPLPAHRAAAKAARRIYATPVDYGADVAVFNAFPKDTEFIQALAALDVWAEREDPQRALVRPGGTIVIITACSEGLGAHELIEYGRRQFKRRDRHGAFRDVFAGRSLLLLAPGVSPVTVERYYGPRARHFRTWRRLRCALEALHPGGTRVRVYPTSALQMPAPCEAG